MMEWKSVRMMKFPRYGNIAFMFQTTNQEVTWSGSNPWLPSNMAGKFTIMEDNGGLLRKIIQRHGDFLSSKPRFTSVGYILGAILYCSYWMLLGTSISWHWIWSRPGLVVPPTVDTGYSAMTRCPNHRNALLHHLFPHGNAFWNAI